jgi:hypothetical protein
MMQRTKIPPVPLVPAPETPEAAAAVGFQWAGAPIGLRHRIGGDPDWIQSPDIPDCSCGKQMTFYAQVDSLGDAHVIGDCGMIYLISEKPQQSVAPARTMAGQAAGR